MLIRPMPLPEELDLGYLGVVMRFNGLESPQDLDKLARHWAGCTGTSCREISRLELLSRIAGLSTRDFVMNHSTLPLRRGITSYLDASSSLQMKRLRTTMAINLFKRFLLGDLHLAGKAQTPLVFDRLARLGVDGLFTEGTWELWFSSKDRIPKLTKIELLDKVASAVLRYRNPRDGSVVALPSGFFYQMVFGGLMSKLLEPTESTRPGHVLQARASDYHPLSAWHLHLDAVELGLITNDHLGLSWQALCVTAARRIQWHLDSLWGRRQGKIYSLLPSILRLQWEASDGEARRRIRASYIRIRPDLFDLALNGGVSPDWAMIAVEPDTPYQQIAQTLFAIAADTDFLLQDRLVAWSMDIATAALALRAVAWADRYMTFARFSNEALYWSAFRQLLFTAEPLVAPHLVTAAMNRCVGAQLHERSTKVLIDAGKAYREELSSLGVSTECVFRVATSVEQTHCLEFRR